MLRLKAGLFFRLAFFLGVALSSPAFAQQATDAQILHVINRLSFGPAPGDMDHVRKIGIDAYIDEQLRPASLPQSQELSSRLSNLDTLNEPTAQLIDDYALPRDAKSLPEDERKELQKREHIVVQQLTAAKILRATLSPAQLQEVMVDFWFNHFNVFAEKGQDKLLIAAYERDAIRPYALGKFGDLLNATARDPAMLIYLDNALNTNPDSPMAAGRKIGINENYAREIMELHTLGVNGGYTQTDVTTLAHILTGWGLSEGRERDQRFGFYFEPRRHDFHDQVWLNYNIRGGGEQEIEQVLNILAHHPATAHHIAYQLAQYFVADDPPQSLVDKLAETFRTSDGDTTEMLRVLFHSKEFWDTKYAQQKFKPPFRYVVSALRASAIELPDDMQKIQGAIGQMGEPLYRCQTPNGYAATNDQWLNSDALLKRIDFSQKLANFLPRDASAEIISTMGRTWTAKTLDTVNAADPKLQSALLLSSPDFVYY